MRSLRSAWPVALYMAAGLVTGAASHPFWKAAVNHLVLLPAYALVIHLWTRSDSPLEPRPLSRRADVAPVAIVVAVIVVLSVWWWLHPRPAAVGGGPPLDPWDLVGSRLHKAVESVLVTLLPTVLLIAVLRLGPADLGLRPRRLGLAVALIGFGVALGWPSTALATMPAYALLLYAIQIFINGLPEELLFRGVLLTRLGALLGSPPAAIALSAMLFSLVHVPVELLMRGSTPAWRIVLDHLPGRQPTGIIWAYLFLRTRSIWPGVLWHTSFERLGRLFF